MTHICVSNLTIIGLDNGLSPGRRQALIWTNAGVLLIRPLGTNLSEILIGIQPSSFRKMRLKMSSGKWRPFCLGLNVFILRAYGSSQLSVVCGSVSTMGRWGCIVFPKPCISLNSNILTPSKCNWYENGSHQAVYYIYFSLVSKMVLRKF